MERCVTDSVELYCSTPRSVTYRQHELQPERPSDNEINTELVSTLKSSACGYKSFVSKGRRAQQLDM
jgi:hypothetical protein